MAKIKKQYVRLFKEVKPTVEKFKQNDTYERKLAFAKSIGFNNISDVIGSLGLAKFKIQFKASKF